MEKYLPDTFGRLRELYLMDWAQRQTYDEAVYRNLAASDYRGALEALVRGYQHAMVGFCTNMLDDASLGEEMA
jgi:hypothetical protein